MRDLIKQTLIEVRNEVVLIDQSKRRMMMLFDKYDLVLSGKDKDKIYVIELLYKLDLNVEVYIDTIPNICDELGLKYFGVVRSHDLFDPEIDIRNFVIELT